MWSIPNMIPLPPEQVHAMWHAVKDLDFDTSYGGFHGMVVHDKDLKKRTLESMKIQIRAEGYDSHTLLNEQVR